MHQLQVSWPTEWAGMDGALMSCSDTGMIDCAGCCYHGALWGNRPSSKEEYLV